MDIQKKRNKKTNAEQMILFINYMKVNKIIINGKCHPLKIKELEEKWDELVTMLNSVENGARKDKKQWKHRKNFDGAIIKATEVEAAIVEPIIKATEVEAAIAEPISEASRTESTPVPTKETNKKAIYKTKKVRGANIKRMSNVGGTSLLQQSAEVYAESSQYMAQAIKEMASSISELATALSLIAREWKNQTGKAEDTTT